MSPPRLLWRCWLASLWVACGLVLTACGLPGSRLPASPSPVAGAPTATRNRPVDAPPSRATPAPATTETPTVPPASPTFAIPSPTLVAELAATVTAAELPPTATPDAPAGAPVFGGIAGVGVLALRLPPGQAVEGAEAHTPIWAAFSQGLAAPDQHHFLGVYMRLPNGWQQLDRVELHDSSYLDAEGVAQVDVTPDRTWIEVQSGTGAHSGVYTLFSFDGATLQREVAGFAASPGAGWLEDLNRDGTLDVVLDASDPYVFCYACGVVERNYQVLRWDGAQMIEVSLAQIPPTAPRDVREPLNRAVELARAGLWQDAELLVNQASATLSAGDLPSDPAATWAMALIRLTAERRAEAARTSTYPLLGNLFYGNYTAVMGILSGYSAEELFGLPSPLVEGTPAEGFRSELIERITVVTTRALARQPDLATAYFLRGWARFLANPAGTDSLADVQQAAALEPDQPLFADSVAYLSIGQTTAPEVNAAQEIIAAARAYMEQRTGQALEMAVVIEKQEGDLARVSITTATTATTSTDTTGPIRVFLQRKDGRWQVLPPGEPPAGPDMPDANTWSETDLPERSQDDQR